MNYVNFGTKLANERNKQKISAYDLSLRLGKEANYINNLEMGKINVTLKMIIEIAECLNVPVSMLLDGVPAKKPKK